MDETNINIKTSKIDYLFMALLLIDLVILNAVISFPNKFSDMFKEYFGIFLLFSVIISSMRFLFSVSEDYKY